jgi:hypothetical protein
MAERPKTVWILGSGFSKGIGAPLLYELLTEKGHLLAQEVFPNTPLRSDVYELFGKYGPASKSAKYWEHAEEFLDLVDAATEQASSPRRKFIEKLLHRINNNLTLNAFRDLATLAIATEVNAHVEIGSLKAEAWKPYLHWAKQLNAQDSIITFNYDTLLEKLGNDPAVLHLKDDGVLLPHKATAIPEERCRIFKLHGSANWAWDEKAGDRFQVFGSTGGFNFKDGYRPLIGTPGGTKQDHVERHFENIWKQAMATLQQAEVIVFMGYRFPPSDSYARRALLHTLTLNGTRSLRIHTVLGPDVRDTATVRLNALLRETLDPTGKIDASLFPVGALGNQPRYRVQNQPLFAEDFMSVLNESTLLREPRLV